MRAEKLLPLLLGAAIGAGGILHGLHLEATRDAPRAGSGGGQDERIAELENELAILKRENASLRSLSQGGGEVAVPPEMVAFVQSAIGRDFKSSPQVHRLAAEELRDRIAAAIEERYGPNGLDSRQQAWTLMGFLGPEDRFEGQLAAMKSIGTRSWFDAASGEAWVTDRYDPQSIPDQAAMIRALSLILTHQHFPPPPGWPGDETALTREAAHEGAARVLEDRFLAKEALHSGFTGAAPSTDDRELIAHLPAFIRGTANFATLYGKAREKPLLEQPQKLAAELHQPPTLTAQFYPGHEGAPASLPELPETPGSMMLEESAGMLGVKLWLGEESEALGDAWAGDRYRLYAIDDETVNLVWEVRFTGAEAAAAFEKAAMEIVARLSKVQEGRKLHLERPSPDTVRLVNVVE
ncbi:MAG: hypothetical protein JWO82_2827 [Akkermansiaceae bacterium]|nr:hypothetical protein [Akkermansiaceae bacterium]